MQTKKTIRASVITTLIVLAMGYLLFIIIRSDFVLSVVPSWHTTVAPPNVLIAILMLSVLIAVLIAIKIFKTVKRTLSRP